MFSAIGGWLASKGASLLLGFIASMIKDAIATRQKSRVDTDLGRETAERDQAVEGLKARERMEIAGGDADFDRALDDARKGQL